MRTGANEEIITERLQKRFAKTTFTRFVIQNNLAISDRRDSFFFSLHSLRKRVSEETVPFCWLKIFILKVM